MIKRALAFVTLALATAHAADTNTIRAIKDELARSMAKLELAGAGKPYFLSYQLYDLQRVHVSASFGALIDSEDVPRRTVDIDLRVGDYAFDNSNTADRDARRSITLGHDDDYDVVRRALWLITDRIFKHATETLARKRALASAQTKDPNAATSFSKEPPSHVEDLHAPPPLDHAALEALAKQLSAVFRANPDVYQSNVAISGASGMHYFMSSEGSESVAPEAFVRITVECDTQADDGMPLRDSMDVFVRTVDELPPTAELVARAEALSKELSALRAAPVVDDYDGPVLFAGVAAGQVIRSLLADDFAGTPGVPSDRPGGHPVGESELAGKLDQRILPKTVGVVDDPAQRKVGTQVLVGGEKLDEEGVLAQRVSLVEHGVFKRFLMSRIPRKGFEHTNGHGASTPSSGVRAHPMNLIVTASNGVADAELRKRAQAAAKEEGLKYVLVVTKLDAHISIDDFDPGAFDRNATLAKPAVIERLYPDGHSQLVRGATFGAVPPRSLKDLVAIGSTPTVYSFLGVGIASRFASMFDTGSGYLVSIATPGFVVNDVEVKAPRGAQRSAPVAPRPR